MKGWNIIENDLGWCEARQGHEGDKWLCTDGIVRESQQVLALNRDSNGHPFSGTNHRPIGTMICTAHTAIRSSPRRALPMARAASAGAAVR